MSETFVPSAGHGLTRAPLSIEEIQQRITDAFPAVTATHQHAELTLHAEADVLVELLTFCREDDELCFEMLVDLSGVHWPAGEHVIERQSSTTGWPEYRISREQGVIEVLYVLRSFSRNHHVRISVATDDEAARLPSVTGVYRTANFHEREVYDFFGVEFEGHPDMTRILMPDDWLGHPHRKDYPLGGVEVEYKHDKFIPPPDQRDLREVID
ncbi:MAG: NADH-quinone oxidoreductase subunit C [Nitriliruptoraceae bacterium]|nr:NADH-quinone oxidoreductase subunit C [Nitriliruptoraceae bacterium]